MVLLKYRTSILMTRLVEVIGLYKDLVSIIEMLGLT